MTLFAAIQMSSGPQVPANLLQAEKLIFIAARQGAKLVVLPENFAFMGMSEADKLEHQEPLGEGPLQTFLANQARKHGVWLLGGTIPMSSSVKDKVYAASLLFNDRGEQVAHYNKIHLFDVTLPDSGEQYFESSHITPGEDVVVTDTPFGRIGIAVCYDLRFPELFRAMQAQGAEIFLLPAAFTERTGKAHWEILLRARAIENLSYMVAAAQGGYHINGRSTYGHSMVVDPWGSVLQVRDNLTPGIVMAPVDTRQVQNVRQRFPALSHRHL